MPNGGSRSTKSLSNLLKGIRRAGEFGAISEVYI